MTRMTNTTMGADEPDRSRALRAAPAILAIGSVLAAGSADAVPRRPRMPEPATSSVVRGDLLVDF